MPSQIIETDTKEMRVRCRNRPTQWVIRSFLRAASEGHTKGSDSADKTEVSRSSTSEAVLPISPLNPEVLEFVPSSGNFIPTEFYSIRLSNLR